MNPRVWTEFRKSIIFIRSTFSMLQNEKMKVDKFE